MKLDLLTNSTVVDDAIRFVSYRSKENPKLSSDNSNEDDAKESIEPDYYEGSRETNNTAMTTNEAF